MIARIKITKLVLIFFSINPICWSNENESNDDNHNTIVVTSTKEERSKLELPESIAVIDSQEIEDVSPSHPAELLNRVPGVHINNLGGEGHMSSIRQPITTAGVYLFLEDGIPTRPSGFFNHNGLYEINIPQSNRIEVIKGTGSALYGSDAIGGIVNSITNPTPDTTEVKANLEIGSNGWQRGLISYGTNLSDTDGIRIDLNLTENDGYREESSYSRQSTTLRYDNQINQQWDVKTTFSYSKIEQSGVSSLEEGDYLNHPEKTFIMMT
ncbi:TonB-dependent receptor [Aliikangiella sp. IMCC44359]|uniref:TonB-dependent receptor n=1 Tax=Aliikangiella sp. IMCC44359 TaxID=3459125 RepID=UPI00403B05AF